MKKLFIAFVFGLTLMVGSANAQQLTVSDCSAVKTSSIVLAQHIVDGADGESLLRNFRNLYPEHYVRIGKYLEIVGYGTPHMMTMYPNHRVPAIMQALATKHCLEENGFM